MTYPQMWIRLFVIRNRSATGEPLLPGAVGYLGIGGVKNGRLVGEGF